MRSACCFGLGSAGVAFGAFGLWHFRSNGSLLFRLPRCSSARHLVLPLVVTCFREEVTDLEIIGPAGRFSKRCAKSLFGKLLDLPDYGLGRPDETVVRLAGQEMKRGRTQVAYHDQHTDKEGCRIVCSLRVANQFLGSHSDS